jgi:YggT family protein
MADALFGIIIWLLYALMFALLGRAILSWVDPTGQWTISRLLADVTEPIVAPLRRVIPPVGMFDISFIVAFIVIRLLIMFLEQAMR